MKHRLDPLLRPRSVAVVGASASKDSLGEWALGNLLLGGYQGGLYPVNPNYEELQGRRCFASLADLPETPDLVVFAVGDHRIEASLDEAIAAGVPAAVIQSTLYLDDDPEPHLRERVQEKVRNAGMLVCGANGMGFYNVRDGVWTCGFDSASHQVPGNVALISHSGAGMSGIIDCEERLRINVAVSTGNELSVTMDEYLDFVLDLPETRAVGLFIETARNPEGLRKALAKAVERCVPIVALKVGRTKRSAELAISHSGALAGVDATYDALFDRYGVQRARDQDEFTTMLIMLAEMHPVGAGGLITVHDSGGERQLLVDLADDADVPLAELSKDTVAALEDILDPELPATNPLDAWSRGGPNAAESITRCLTLMMQDPGAAVGAVIHDRGPGGAIYPGYLAYMQRAHADSGKPIALVSARQGTGYDSLATTSTHAGLPVLDGVSQFLAGVRAMFAYRDFRQRKAPEHGVQDMEGLARWRSSLANGRTLGESASLKLLSEFGIEVTATVAASSADDAVAAAGAIGYPAALKTAAVGVLHKSDQGGVVLNIEDEGQLRGAYQDISNRLGNDVLVSAMAPQGIEMLLGIKRDQQFGPVVLMGFGGVLAETMSDIQFALPPFDAEHARRCVDRMRLRPLLDGVRGEPPVAIDAFCEAAANFSELAGALADDVMEADVNPLIVHRDGVIAVDALFIGRDEKDGQDAET